VFVKPVKSINFLGKRIPVPANFIVRVIFGVALVLGGLLGFLPVLGYWMVPVGLLILSIDFPAIRRFRRRATVKLVGWFKRKFPGLATKMGLT
jgi:purine-cytosine permease-like protein